ncbi:hypothetical protein JB92DRAFT_2937781 [Gautieria morchelliformis]|nr:hypothetical protein JB92DRAFT_2937781 [Gautieria morchelliformis]
MSTPVNYGTLSSPGIDEIRIFYSARYVIASVYIVLLLEHLASFPQEVEFIWAQKGRGKLARVFFLSYRYSAVVGLTIINHLLAGGILPGQDNSSVSLTPHSKPK